jgi:sugar/nucleoside kinase (ribokinase family)
MSDKRYDAIVAGHLCLDLNPAFAVDGGQSIRDILVPGKLVNMGQVALSTGGAVSNTGISMKLLGLNVSLMGKIGDDLLGGVVSKILQGYGVADGLIVDPTVSTSYSVVIAPPGVDRIFLHHPGANDSFAAQDIDQARVAQARLFHFGYPPLMRRMFENSGDELIRLLGQVRALGTATSLDLALPDPASAAGQADWQHILGRALPLTDIFLPSLEELFYMLDRRSFEAIKQQAGDQDFLSFCDYSRLPGLAGQLLDLGVRIVVIKLGRRGFYVRTAADLTGLGAAAPSDPTNWSGREIWAEVFDVPNIASTSGAGDASIAGFLAGLLTGQRIETACELACATAGLKIQVKTSVGGILPLSDTLSRIPVWAKERLELDPTYWHYDGNDRLWYGLTDRAPTQAD